MSATPEGRVLLLLPTYNEEEAIATVIDSAKRIFRGLPYVGFDVLVVDGHSTDRTREIASERGAIVTKQPGSGKGDAIRFGFEQANNHTALVMMDADWTYPAEEIPRLLSRLSRGADIVMGSRIRGEIDNGAMKEAHYMGNRALSYLASFIYGKEVSDVCTGMWALTSSALRKLQLNSNHFEVEAEIFAQACKAGLKVVEIPIRYRRRLGRRKLKTLRAGISIATKLLRKRFFP